MSVERYNARTAEIRWQQAWRMQNVSACTCDRHPECDGRAKSADTSGGRIRACDLRRCIIADVIARYNRVCGVDMQHPAEGDPAGRPAEIAAVAGAALRSLGLSFDWSRQVGDWDPGSGDPARRDPGHGRLAACPAGTGDPVGVDAGEIIDTYGADATRWSVLSGSPPGRDMTWSETGLHGAWRFVQRLWRLINNAKKFSEGAPATRPAAFSAPALDLRKTAHRALAQVSCGIDKWRFPVCIAHIHAFARTLEAVVTDSCEPASPDLKFAAREAAEIIVQLFHPMMPHLAEECWAALGHRRLLATRRWPALQADLLVEDTVTLPVHVNGRRRADVTVARDARNSDIEVSALALDAVRRALDGKTPRKVIIVPQRIINVVA